MERWRADGSFLQTINIMYSKLASMQTGKADKVVKPKVGHISSSDFFRRHEAIFEGEKAATEAMPKVKEIIDRLKQEGRLN